jgi:hypothetical protein
LEISEIENKFMARKRQRTKAEFEGIGITWTLDTLIKIE